MEFATESSKVEQHFVLQVLDVSEERDEVNKAAVFLVKLAVSNLCYETLTTQQVWRLSILICLKLISSPVRLKMQRTSQIPQ